jgi:hypothetical protein
MDAEEIQRRSAVLEAVTRDLEQAGLLGNPKVDRQAIMEGLLRGDKSDPHVRQYVAIQDYGNPDYELKPYDDAPLGMPPEAVRQNMHRGFQGRGWSESEQQALGRPVQNRELSPGDRQAQELARRRQFASSLLDAGADTAPSTYNYGSPSGPMPSTRVLKDAAVGEFDRTRGQKFGESGWGGALQNPEYLAGDLMTRYLDPMVNYFEYRLHEGMDGDEADRTAQRLTQAAKMSNTLATKIPRKFDTSTPEAKEKSYKAVKGIYKGLIPKSYDDAERQRTGQYPSYAWSAGEKFLTNLADPTTLAALAAGGLSLARGIPGAFGKALLKDSVAEEMPAYAALSGAMGSFYNIPDKPFDSGNEARTDLYNPETGKPETKDEFDKKMGTWKQKRREAHQNFNTYEGYGRPLMTR